MAFECGPEVSGGVLVDFEVGDLGEFFAEEFSCGGPGGGECDALCAVGVAGEGAEFFEVGDGALWIKCFGFIHAFPLVPASRFWKITSVVFDADFEEYDAMYPQSAR